MRKPLKPVAAELIHKYLTEKGTATRPELARKLSLREEAIDTAIRKLSALHMVKDTGVTRQEGGPRPAHIFCLGARPFSRDAIRRSGNPHPKGKQDTRNLTIVQGDSLSTLESIMRGMVHHANAQHTEDIHPGSGDDNGGLGPRLSGPEDSDMGERLQRDEGFIPGGAETLPRHRS